MTHNPCCTLRLESFEINQLKESIKSVTSLANEYQLDLSSCVSLPTRKKVITLLRSPHIDKKSREQFESRTYRRLLIIKSTHSEKLDSFIDALKNSLPIATSLKIKFFNYS